MFFLPYVSSARFLNFAVKASPSRCSLVQVNHWNIRRMLITSLTTFWCLYDCLWTDFIHCSDVSIVDFEQLIFLNCYLAAPRPSLGYYRGGSLTHPMLIACVLHIRPEGRREPRSGVGSLSPAECLVGFEPGTFRFWSQHLNPLGHSPVK